MFCRSSKVPQPTDDPAAFFAPAHEMPIVLANTIPPLCRHAQNGENEQPSYVYLRGARTKFGVGILHDAKATVLTNYECKDHNGEDVAMRSTELVVMDVSSRSANAGTFSRDGDSGAPVRMRDGRVIGILFGRVKGLRPTSYVSVAETLLRDIQQSLGADEVELVSYETVRERLAVE